MSRRVLSAAYSALGLTSLGLGLLGAFLPVLPTTPFVLLAAFFFARARPEWHARLRAHATFGPIVRDWEDRGAIRPRAKALATLMIAGLCAWMWAAPRMPLAAKLAVTAVEAGVIAFLLTRPNR